MLNLWFGSLHHRTNPRDKIRVYVRQASGLDALDLMTNLMVKEARPHDSILTQVTDSKGPDKINKN